MEDKKEAIEEIINIKNKMPRLLKANEIDCRVGTISAKGCSLLLYKDARVDMAILDETYGVGNWQRTHQVINENLFCTIEIWNDEIKQWVKKQDVGTESFTEKEKGEASDSFKRAGFNVGIGRELYTGPFIWIIPSKDMVPYNAYEVIWDEENKKEKSQKTDSEFYAYKLDQYHKGICTTKTSFKVDEIGYNENREINKLIIKDNKDNIRFSMMPLEEQKDKLQNEPISKERLQGLIEWFAELEMNEEQFLNGIKLTSMTEINVSNVSKIEDMLLKYQTKLKK